MNEQATNSAVDMDKTELDLLDMISLLWSKIWIIIISMVLCGAIAFAGAMISVVPQYTATAMMYVNNSSLSVGGSTISFTASQLNAAKSLLNVYIIILKSRTTLEAAIEAGDLPYTYEQLRGIVTAGSVDGTEIFNIKATCENPGDAKLIVDTIVDLLPDRISDIVDGSSVRLVDHAVLPAASSSPSNTRYALIGALAGLVASCGLIIVQDLMNTTVRDEEYLKQRYNIPILAVVPDVYGISKKKYGYKYGYHSKYRYGYHRHGYYRSSHNRYEDSYNNVKAENGESK